MNIEQLLVAAKILEQRDEGKFCQFPCENLVAHVISRPANILFAPQTSEEANSGVCQTREKANETFTELQVRFTALSV